MTRPTTRPAPWRRDAFPYALTLTTRWRDNDVYAHMNNVVHYEYFDTAVNRWLIDIGFLDFVDGATIGLVVETRCRHFSPLGFPEDVIAALRVAHLGRSSLVYEIGLFRPEAQEASAQGCFAHVYVDRVGRRPTPIPDRLRRAAEAILRQG